MKRIESVVGITGTAPAEFNPTGEPRSIFEPLRLDLGGPSNCWRCSDQPCMSFAYTEISQPLFVEAPRNPDTSVCPTGALTVGPGAVPAVTAAQCIGCGLCVVRCPVGAVYLDPISALPVFSDGVADEAQATEGSSFAQARSTAENLQAWRHPPFDDAAKTLVQVTRALAVLPTVPSGAAFRLLVRNAFLVSGDNARMSNTGDNTFWAEVVAEKVGVHAARSDAVAVVQIEAESVRLDAHRRLLTGMAVAVNRAGLSKGAIVPAIAVSLPPNARTDYYRMLADATRWLNTKIRTLPLAVLYLAIRDRSRSLVELLEAGPYVDANALSSSEFVEQTFGSGAGDLPGLTPRK